MARENMAHVRAGNRPSQEPGVLRMPVENYLDPARWAAEVALFKRLPLMLALGGELRGGSSYKAMTAMDVPVLLDATTPTATCTRSSTSAAIAAPW